MSLASRKLDLEVRILSLLMLTWAIPVAKEVVRDNGGSLTDEADCMVLKSFTNYHISFFNS